MHSKRSTASRWRWLAILAVVILTVGTGYVLFGVPFEVSESVDNLVQLRNSASPWDAAIKAGFLPGFFRPMSWATTKAIFDLSGGHFFEVYRSFHVLQVFLALALSLMLMRVEDGRSFAVALLGLTALLGIHTFHESVRETEINIKLLLAICALAAFALAESRRRRFSDIAAVTLVAYSLLTNELGLLVWVALAAAYLVGCPGVGRRAVAMSTALVAAYLVFRLWPGGVGPPAFAERNSGFGFLMRDPAELEALFGHRPLPFYAYNVASSVLTVLLSEPRGGMFLFTRDALNGAARPWHLAEVISSLIVLVLMLRLVATRWREWSQLRFRHGDRLFLVFMAVLLANAAISYPYTKDVNMAPAGVFYALGLYAAVHAYLREQGRAGMLRTAAVPALLLVLSLTWASRGLGFFADLTRTAYRAQADWIFVYEWAELQNVDISDPRNTALVERLRQEALALPVPRPYAEHRWIPGGIDPIH